jgi:adenylate cyclase
VRLACQTRPTADVEVMPLLPPSVAPAQSTLFPDYHHGRDMRIVVMFADLRGFTTFSESRLPYDVVFLLNRYFREMGEAITSAQGHVDKFIGDGIMALFGLDDGPDGGAVDGLRAARRMIDRLDALNAEMRDDLEAPLRIGIGLHVGTAIVGDLGWGTATTLTAIGDVVNTASRLEGLTKDYHCQIIASEEVLALAGLDMSAFEAHSITPRGKAEEIGIAVVRNLTALPA